MIIEKTERESMYRALCVHSKKKTIKAFYFYTSIARGNLQPCRQCFRKLLQHGWT